MMRGPHASLRGTQASGVAKYQPNIMHVTLYYKRPINHLYPKQSFVSIPVEPCCHHLLHHSDESCGAFQLGPPVGGPLPEDGRGKKCGDVPWAQIVMVCCCEVMLEEEHGSCRVWKSSSLLVWEGGET